MAPVVGKALPESDMTKQTGFADMQAQTEPDRAAKTINSPWPVPELDVLRSKGPPEPINSMQDLAAKLTKASVRTWRIDASSIAM